MALHARRSGTGRPARLSVAESEALLNRVNLTARRKLPGGRLEREKLHNAIAKLAAVVHGDPNEEKASCS